MKIACLSNGLAQGIACLGSVVWVVRVREIQGAGHVVIAILMLLKK